MASRIHREVHVRFWLYFESFSREYRVTLKHELRYTVSLGTDVFGNLQRIDNTLDGLAAKIADAKQELEGAKSDRVPER